MTVIDSFAPVKEHNRPEGLIGWEDVLHKAELSKGEQEEINELQRDYGLEESVF